MALRKKAMPQAQSAVAASICSSLITRVFPTASKMRLVNSTDAAAEVLTEAMQVMDSPMAMDVLGMARTSEVSLPRCLRRSPPVTPDTMETRSKEHTHERQSLFRTSYAVTY